MSGERNAKGQFVTGTIGNPNGRPKGSRDKLGAAFIEALYAHWQVHGVTALDDCATQNPAAYIKTVASLLPQQKEVTVSGVEQLSDAELAECIAAVRNAAALAGTSRGGSKEKGGSSVAH